MPDGRSSAELSASMASAMRQAAAEWVVEEVEDLGKDENDARPIGVLVRLIQQLQSSLAAATELQGLLSGTHPGSFTAHCFDSSELRSPIAERKSVLSSGSLGAARKSLVSVEFEEDSADDIKVSPPRTASMRMSVKSNTDLRLAPTWAPLDEDDDDAEFWSELRGALVRHPSFDSGRDRRQSRMSRRRSSLMTFLQQSIGLSVLSQASEPVSVASMVREGSHVVRSVCSGKLMILPTSGMRVGWDVLGLMCFLVELWVAPLQLFIPGESESQRLILLVCLAYWTTSIPICFFCTHYNAEGELEQRPACHYLKTWFIYDLVLVCIDWTDLLMEYMPGLAAYSSAGYTARAFRFFRLLRVLRVNGMLENTLEDRYDFGIVGTLARILKWSVSTISLIHLLACGWYAVGIFCAEGNVSWIRESEMLSRSVGYQYFTSLHWALGQFSPTKLSEVPTTLMERIYATLTGSLVIVANPLLVGTITTAMVGLQNMRHSKLMQRTQLRKYLAKHTISPTLRRRIFSFLSGSRRPQHLTAKGVSLLADLPAEMYSALRLEVIRPLLGCHPFFDHHLRQHSDQAMLRTMAMDVISELHLDQGKRLFAMGDLARNMYFLVMGELDYVARIMVSRSASRMSHPQASPEHDQPVVVRTKEWLSEQALWLHSYKHQGVTTAIWHSELLSVEGAGVQRLLAEDPIVKYYARCFFAEGLPEHGCLSSVLPVVQRALKGPDLRRFGSNRSSSQTSLGKSVMEPNPLDEPSLVQHNGEAFNPRQDRLVSDADPAVLEDLGRWVEQLDHGSDNALLSPEAPQSSGVQRSAGLSVP